MTDPYRLLNVPRDADPATLKSAYRKLAKALHPDRNPGDAHAEQRFKEVTQAYHLLADPATRARYDHGQVDAEGRPRADFAFGGGAGGPFGSGGEGFFDRVFGAAFNRAGGAGGAGGGGPSIEDVLRGHQQRARRPGRGRDRHYPVTVGFLIAARGGRQRLELGGGRQIEITVPPGTDQGTTLRLEGQGDPGTAGGRQGDALVEIAVEAHPRFTRRGLDIHLDLPVSLPEVVQGAKVRVPTILRPVQITVPKGANSGQVLRLKGKGITRAGAAPGDQYVKLMVVLPDPPDPELDAFLERWAAGHGYDVRAALEDD